MAQHSYLAFYKPYGVLSQFSPEPGSEKPTLARYIDVPDVYPIGRLDHDSEGLMLLSDDGALQHLLTDPKYGHPRTYWVQVEGNASEVEMSQLRAGVAIQGALTRPALADVLDHLDPEPLPRDPPIRFRAAIPTSWIELTITEGRNRQVRRMTAAVGLPTLRLIRVAIGKLTWVGLAPGEYRRLTAAELGELRKR